MLSLPMNAKILVFTELHNLRTSKGLPQVTINNESVLLGDELGLDSLDLATLVVTLEELTGLAPFNGGFVMFKTVGELISLFSTT